MATIAHSLSPTLFAFLLFAIPTLISAEFSQFFPSPSPSPELISPSPSPALANYSPPPSPLEDSDASYDHKNSPAPSPIEDNGASSENQNSPISSPAPSPIEGNGASSENQNSPSPAPDVAADISHDDRTTTGDLKTNDDSNGGKTAGIAIGVIAAACILGVGSVVYKKRQRNIRRSQYQYSHVTTRRDIL